jgi:signal peptide peptidase SppA
MDFDLKFWAGTEESLAIYLATMRAVLMAGGEASLRQAEYRDDADQAERMSRLVTKAGDLAIIKIAGPLNNTDSWMNEYRGMTGYPEIRAALVQVATDAEVQGVILDVNSGGGAVSGVFDTAKLIQQVDKIKPVHAFSDGQICSAAYLLGSSARTLSIGRMTEAGSIGVLTVHQEMSKLMKEIGITPTVLRAGKYKAMGNPYEPLSEAAQAEIQGQLDYMYQVFVEHVADRRKVTYDVADKKLAQGRVFIGDKAAEIELVDAVTTFDDVASKLQRGIDSKNRAAQSAPNFTQGKLVAEKKPLTEQDVAVLALGAAASGDQTPEQKLAAEIAAKQVADKAAADKKAADDKAAASAAAHGGGSGGAPEKEAEVVSLLKAQLAERDEKIVAQAVELRDAKAENETLKTTSKGMRSVVETSVGYLRVAMKTSGADVAQMTDAALLSEQTSLRTQFEKTFKAGGVASVSTEDSANKDGARKADANEEVRRKARIDATR